MIKIIFYIAIIIIFLKVIIETFFMKKQCSFDIYFGVPGSGKTTFAAYLSRKRLKKKGTVYSNVPIKGTYQLNPVEDLGTYDTSNALIIVDEAGIEYNNRNFKNFKKNNLEFYKYHRHYKCDVAIFSQDYADMDLKLRKLATQYFLVQKSFFPFFIKRKLIRKKIGIDDLTHDIIDQYYFVLFGSKWIFCPKLWKMFNTEEHKELQKKNWIKY